MIAACKESMVLLGHWLAKEQSRDLLSLRSRYLVGVQSVIGWAQHLRHLVGVAITSSGGGVYKRELVIIQVHMHSVESSGAYAP